MSEMSPRARTQLPETCYSQKTVRLQLHQMLYDFKVENFGLLNESCKLLLRPAESYLCIRDN